MQLMKNDTQNKSSIIEKLRSIFREAEMKNNNKRMGMEARQAEHNVKIVYSNIKLIKTLS